MYLVFNPEYSWLISYLDNDAIWLESSINWENVFDLTVSEFTIYSFLTTPFFSNSHIFLDSLTKLSFIDILFMFESNKQTYSKELYDLFIWDISTSFTNTFLPLQFFFYTDYQDFVSVVLQYSPELIIAISDFLDNYWINFILNQTPVAVFDSFNDSLSNSISEFLNRLIAFGIFLWLIIITLSIFNLLKWNNPLETYFIKIIYYLNSISRESRIQLEAAIQTFFFFVFYWSMLISTWDDDQEELIEIFDTCVFIFFCFLIFFLIFKYSQHYFAFLEASAVEGRSVSFILKQFFRDFINTFALLLRFFILLFRLNVYDTLDDFYDSYYIFVGDFDDDEYISELFFSINSAFFFYDFDNNDDRSYLLEDENEFFMDLYYLYFTVWSKFFTFIFFILEEILRLSLAFYICYLIIFEVHSVNCSYIEDNYFLNLRSKKYKFIK